MIDKPGMCTGQFWTSAASNYDFITVAYPICVVDLGKPVELGGLFQRSSASDVWTRATAKTNIIPIEKHPFGLSIVGGATWDLITGANTGGFINLPVTIQVQDRLRINLNGGWLYDNVNKISYAIWGAGFEWGFVEKKLRLIGEVFGQAGAQPAVNPGDPPSPNSIIEPRTKIGKRFAPNEKFNIDLIRGRNITGENAQWVTLGLNVHFDLGR